MKVLNDWGSGGQVAITMKNIGVTYSNGWTVEFDMDIQGEVTNSWGDGFGLVVELHLVCTKNAVYMNCE